MGFVKTTTIPGVQSTQAIMGPGSFGVSQNNIFIFGNRRDILSAESTLPIPVPSAGYPFYQMYETYQLPELYTFDGNALVSYFDKCGFSVGWGHSAEQTILGVSAVDVTTLASDTQAIVYYSSSSDLVSPMVGSSVVGTFNDTTSSVTGTIVSAETGEFTIGSSTYDSYIILESVDFASITIGDSISFSFTDYSIAAPNPAETEPFIMNLYHAANSANVPDGSSNPNRTLSTPKVYFSILPDAANSGVFGPTGSTINLNGPTSVSGEVLAFSSSIDNAYLIPLSEVGSSTITQSSATGTIESSEINGDTIFVTLKDVTGTFVNTTACTMDLDAGKTIGSFQQELFATLNISLQQLAIPYEISSSSQITTTYKVIFDHVIALNEAKYSVNGQAICQAVFARIGISDVEAFNTLPTNVNSWMYEPVFYNYRPSVSDIIISAGNVASAYAMVIGSNVYPINPQAGIILNSLPVVSTKPTSVRVGGYADMIQKLGWNVIAVNTNKKPYVIAPRTGQTTIPGTPTPDSEFYPEYLWQTIDYCRLSAIMYLQSLGLGQIRQTPSVMKRIKGDLYSIMSNISTAGLVKPLESSQIIVVQDETNPLGIDVTISMQVTPGLYFAFVTFNVFSSLVTITKE